MQTGAGWAPQAIRQPGWLPSLQVQPTLLDLTPMTTTTQTAIVYMEETTFTNNAAERAEGANNAGEAALALTQRTSNVREITVWIPVTREQMDDVSYVQAYVNNRLTLMMRQRLNTQIATGNGIAPNLAGIIGMANVQVQPLGADPVLDCLYKGLTAVQVNGGAEPDAFAMNPLDWQDIRLTRTLDGVYILGNPSEPGPMRLWGLPVVTNAAITQGTGLVGDFANYSELAVKQGLQFEYTDSHAALFIQRTLAILASFRAAFTVYRPAAFCQCTGI
jgi:HK97 family phage major capsid protein